MIIASYFHSSHIFFTSCNKSHLRVQQIHQLLNCTSFSSVWESEFHQFSIKFASTFISHISFTISATFLSHLCFKILFKRVVLPAHKNQLKTVTGIFFISKILMVKLIAIIANS
ncbi:MAG: hypothetical protein LBC61_00375 [Candidatus Peribacteria bacterium]|nr:hypothetical protein [Candidatus Peribacteria bacterium]